MQPARTLTLDLLRAIAVLLVLGRHLSLPAPEVTGLLHYPLALWNIGGWVGVDLFFVLSGFLVSGLLFKEHQRFGRISVKSFLIRRGLKIYPPFYLLLAFTAAVELLGYVRSSPSTLLRELLFVQNYGAGYWPHTWSLAVEEHFYLLLPCFLAFLLWRNGGRASGAFDDVPRIFLGVALFCLSARLYLIAAAPYDHLTHLFPTHLRIDSLLFGVVLAYYKHYRPEFFARVGQEHRRLLLAAGTLCLAPAFVLPVETTWQVPTFGLSLFYLGAGLIVWAVDGLEMGESTLTRAASFLGARSYSIFLWHMPVALWGIPALGQVLPLANWYVYLMAYLGGSVLVGVVMDAVVEGPMRRTRDHYFPSRSHAGGEARVPVYETAPIDLVAERPRREVALPYA